MKNYKECTDTEFNKALDVMHEIKAGTVSIETVATAQLYIMYTKMRADYSHLSNVVGSYALGLRISTRKIMETLEAELIRRKIIPG